MLTTLVQEIYDSGMTEKAIAMACATSQPTVNRIRTGKTQDPGSRLAERLKALHGERRALGLLRDSRSAATG